MDLGGSGKSTHRASYLHCFSQVGERLYERIFKHYTKKQWDKYPAELDASVLMRLPCRTSTDDRYFNDEWQAKLSRSMLRFRSMLNRFHCSLVHFSSSLYCTHVQS